MTNVTRTERFAVTPRIVSNDMDDLWTIDALKVGHAWIPASELAFRDTTGRVLDVPLIMFVLRSGSRTIVVDTGGPTDEEHIKRHHPFPYVCPPEMHPERVLAGIGVNPADVEAVVNTHLHWDHCSNNHLFPNATVYLQRAELDYALSPVPVHRVAFELHDEIVPPWVESLDRLQLLDGAHELAPGVNVVPLPGHTPGSQGVVVDTREGTYILPGDCLDLAENWDGGIAGGPRPSSSFTNLIDFYDSLHLMKDSGWIPIPSHDEEALERRRFG